MWAMYGAVTTEIAVLYARRSDVPRVRGGNGVAAGLGHALVFLDHPVALAAPGLGALAVARLPRSAVAPAVRRAAAATGIVTAVGAIALKRLRADARRADALGVGTTALALALTIEGGRASRVGTAAPWGRGDPARLGAAAVIVAVGLPWIFADAGTYVGDIPVLGAPFLSRGYVHLGHHHGMDGVLLALTALALSRPLGQIRSPVPRELLSAYLALLLAYGVARAAQDAWHEQVWKRGWTSVVLPEVVMRGRPVPTPAWGILVAAAALVHVGWFRRRAERLGSRVEGGAATASSVTRRYNRASRSRLIRVPWREQPMTITATELVSEETYRRLSLDDRYAHCELHDGRLLEKPGMSVEHGDTMVLLATTLAGQLDRNEYRLRIDHARLRRSSRNYYIPDLAVVPTALERALRQNPGSLDAYAEPLPLVVEIWSPSTGGYDIGAKLPEYQQRGDREIWYIHPYERTLTAWRRQPDGSYAETVYRGGKVRPESLPNVEIDLDALFAE